MNRPCAVYQCTKSASMRVWYRSQVGKTSTESWTKVCLGHAQPDNFPISWGVITKTVALK